MQQIGLGLLLESGFRGWGLYFLSWCDSHCCCGVYKSAEEGGTYEVMETNRS